MRTTLLAVAVFISGCASNTSVAPTSLDHSDPLVISAEAGKYNYKTLDGPSEKGAISYFVRLSQMAGGTKWVPSAYIGFLQGDTLHNSVQLIVFRNSDDDTDLTIAYRIVEARKILRTVNLAHAPFDTKIPVKLTFDRGNVSIKIGDRAPVSVQTALTIVSPFASVSSGTAEFARSPDK